VVIRESSCIEQARLPVANCFLHFELCLSRFVIFILMRIIPFLISGIITVALIILFSMRLPVGNSSLPPLGEFLSPQQGFWQNAEPVDETFSLDLNFPRLKDQVTVYFDERLVPHVFAKNDDDLYFVQGYLHARFRLWQMEFQTHAAAGRLSEIVGPGPNNGAINFDRNMRRLGMVYGAQRSLEAMETDPVTKAMMDAYTAGVNAYISQLSRKDLPLEYRLLDYKPEPWSNMKTALFLKYMSYDLTGAENDIEYTNLRNVLKAADFDALFPISRDSLDPIVPKGTVFDNASVQPKMPASADSLYFTWEKNFSAVAAAPLHKPDFDNGSNNWAVDGTKTQSGRPILCNDPHLGLNLPSLWYEIQLHTPEHSVYGVSFPGSPGVIIGFNDSIAWGVTNAARDVKDYYEIQFKDESKNEYWFNGEWKPAILRFDTIKVRDAAPVYDTVAYTVFGPVQYDRSFGGARTHSNVNLAVRWKAHDPSNELKTFYLLNRATNYDAYVEAIRNFTCPAQNFVFAAKNNDIAIWQQGALPAKWRRQGDFIMPGTDSSYMWQDTIPMEENPHVVRPARGYVSSANQLPADSTYPYYLGGVYDLYRGLLINRYLRQMFNVSPQHMQQLQTENYNVLAEMILPLMLRNVMVGNLTAGEEKILEIVRNWNYRNDPQERGATIFTIWFDKLEQEIWHDELAIAKDSITMPQEATLAEALLRDSAFRFIDNVNTAGVETLPQVVTTAFRKMANMVEQLDRAGRLSWSAYKATQVTHLARLEPFSRLNLATGGGTHIINATKSKHGPSWRMVVHLTDETEAYGIYPGGQSGNPGSRYYDNFIDSWAAGKYNTLWVMKENEGADKRVIGTMTFTR
jgi:penicillin amidase